MNWQMLEDTINEMWDDYLGQHDKDRKNELKREIREAAPKAVLAAWSLKHWDNFKKYTK